MEYELMQDASTGMWMIRVYRGSQLCGKLRFDTETKDAVVAKLVELGWTERS